MTAILIFLRSYLDLTAGKAAGGLEKFDGLASRGQEIGFRMAQGFHRDGHVESAAMFGAALRFAAGAQCFDEPRFGGFEWRCDSVLYGSQTRCTIKIIFFKTSTWSFLFVLINKGTLSLL